MNNRVKNIKNNRKGKSLKDFSSLFIYFFILGSCSSPQSNQNNLPNDTSENNSYSTTISNPFIDQTKKNEMTTVRSRTGNQFTEIELPKNEGVIDTYTFPHSAGDEIADTNESEKQNPSMSDYEILAKGRSTNREQEMEKREIENTLGVKTLENEIPTQRKSFLSQMDGIKQLYKTGRFESALLKVDQLLLDAPTLPILYQMRGTLLEKIGYSDLALQSWKQALRLEPQNERLKKLIERRERNFINRMPASGGVK